jgi:hypothetical protein
MGAAWRDHGTVIIWAAVGYVLLGVVAVRVFRHRRSRLVELGLVAGTLPWLVMVFTPQAAPWELRAVPLRDVASWFDSGLGTGLTQLVGNLLVLAAVGFFLPIRYRWAAGPGRIAVIAAAASVLIETAQWLFPLGRVSSVDDVLVNTTGAVLFAALSRSWWGAGEPSAAPAAIDRVCETESEGPPRP